LSPLLLVRLIHVRLIMTLLRATLQATGELLRLAGGPRAVRVLSGCTSGNLTRRLSLPDRVLGRSGWKRVSGQVSLGPGYTGRRVGWESFRSATTVPAQESAPVIQSSVQDPSVPGAVKGKKYVITADELAVLLEKTPSEIRLLDVREPKDVEEYGKLPGSINIPLTKLKSALNSEPAQFEAEFGTAKPTKEEAAQMIFYGHCAVKSTTALEIAHKMGYKKARHYPGGWEEWSSRGSPPPKV
jgi:rhodanese-related sulfurtransferase